MELLKNLCAIPATAGHEGELQQYLLDYVQQNQQHWMVQPKIYRGAHLQENLILAFGNPRTAAFAHMDSVGFTVGYLNQLIPIGSPQVENGDVLVGRDSKGPIECTIASNDQEDLIYEFPRAIDRGCVLTFKMDFMESDDFVQSCYLDNRLGVYNLLQIAPTLEHGLLVFSCREEHQGGSMPMLAKFIYENFEITQTLVSDITWVTSGIQHGEGVAISLRDQGIPRAAYVSRIVDLAHKSGARFQLEVESSGSSDARELQASPYPFDWCFIGAPESGVHSPKEKVHKQDIASMIELYSYLMNHL